MIYLLEDDDSIRELVCYSLTKTVMETRGFDRPSAFWSAIKTETPSMILLDIMLPEEDGISVLKKLRASEYTKEVPVMMLTAKGAEFDKVSALDYGADDYMTKPFGVMELTARVKAVLRRVAGSKSISPREEYRTGGLCVSLPTHTVTVDGCPVALTLKEFELLSFLMADAGNVVPREKILSDVWGYTYEGESRTVDVHVRTLRTKLGDAGELIETVRGVGYKIRSDKQ